jgi:hypothetical protein
MTAKIASFAALHLPPRHATSLDMRNSVCSIKHCFGTCRSLPSWQQCMPAATACIIAIASALSCAAPVPAGESATYARLHAELLRRGCTAFRFARVAGPYYEKPLDFRAQRVGAASVHHLCKTMVMENTKLPEELAGVEDPRLAKYYMVLVQYSAAIDAEKLKLFVHKARAARCSAGARASIAAQWMLHGQRQRAKSNLHGAVGCLHLTN